MHRVLLALLGIVLLAPGCRQPQPVTHEGDEAMSEIVREPYGTTRDGVAVERFTLTNRGGRIARVITYGATLSELHVPDRDGRLGDVVLGLDDLAGYEAARPYFGCTTGRVANRIARGRFTLDGVEYQLATNNGPNHLHGGMRGLDKVVWTGTPVSRADGPAVRFDYTSPDGEENYPGTLVIAVTYVLTHDDELRIEYQATTDRATPVNLTHHSYFNLGGPRSGGILDHVLTLHASRITPTDETLIPTGEILAVAGTAYDFRQPQAIGSRIAELPRGYDVNYALDRDDDDSLVPAAEVFDPESGRVMEILTTEPGVQFYSSNFLDGSILGKGGEPYEQYHALCLETQHFPDAVNQPHFPSIILRPGETYRHVTVHRFTTR